MSVLGKVLLWALGIAVVVVLAVVGIRAIQGAAAQALNQASTAAAKSTQTVQAAAAQQAASNPTAMPTSVPTMAPSPTSSPTIVSSPTSAPTSVPPTETPTATMQPTQTPWVVTVTPQQVSNPTTSALGASSQASTTDVVVSTNPYRDGEVIGNMYANLPRIPVGTAENNVVLELSWPGKGFGGYDRAVVVVPLLLSDVQVFVNNASTIHMVRYCGTLMEVETYISDKATHVNAMVVTAANGKGQMPKVSEIGVWGLDLTGTIRSLVLAPDGPLTDTVKSHIEVVNLTLPVAVAPTATPTMTPIPNAAATMTVTVTPVVAKCVPSAIDLGPWEARDRTVQGPAVVNIGRPNEGNSQVRTFVPAGKTVVFLASAGSGWDYTACGEAKAQA